ncbi:MAG: NAD(P)-binding domain-containing protein, partial [Nocardioidaceae bacterium]
SGPEWHLDGSGEHTFEAFFEDRGMRAEEFDPIPIAIFLDHAEWFRERKSLEIDERLVTGLNKPNGGFVATMEDGSTIIADKVLAAPGIGSFLNLPTWHLDVPPALRSHTCELVSFDALADARVVIIGGRESAYEWAALLCDHGAEHVDVVHRHRTPGFAKLSWAFVDQYVDQTLTHRGWWRGLPPSSSEQSLQSSGRSGVSPWSHGSFRASLPTS